MPPRILANLALAISAHAARAKNLEDQDELDQAFRDQSVIRRNHPSRFGN